MPSSSNVCHQVYLENIGRLMDLFPNVFNRQNPLPLVVDAFERIIATPNLGMGDDELDYTLACWCNRREYCRSMVMLRHRHDLQGRVVEPIDAHVLAHESMRYDRFIQRGMM